MYEGMMSEVQRRFGFNNAITVTAQFNVRDVFTGSTHKCNKIRQIRQAASSERRKKRAYTLLISYCKKK